jgi:hypothetical protein
VAVPTNRQNVTLRELDGFCSFNNTAIAMSKSDALDFAAWLIGLGDLDSGCVKFLKMLGPAGEGDFKPGIPNEFEAQPSGEDVILAKPPKDDTFLKPETIQQLAVWLVVSASVATDEERSKRNLSYIPDLSSRLEEICSDLTVAAKRAAGT